MKKKGWIAVTIGCILISAVSCMKTMNIADIKETDDALDPLGYSASGYYGKTQEDLKELLPGVDVVNEESMVFESTTSNTVSCKQVFYFDNNKLTEIQYHYLFKVGDEAEAKFVQQCQRISEIDPEAQPLGLAMPLGEIPMEIKVTEIKAGFWDEMIKRTELSSDMIGYAIYCNESNARGHNETVEPSGWKSAYVVEVEAYFYYSGLNEKTYIEEERGSILLDGAEAQIILRIATWD